MNAGFYLIKEVWKKYTYPIFDKDEVEMYQFISKLPLGQIKAELAELKRYTISIEKAFKSKNQKNPNDHIDEHCEELMHEAKEKYTALEESFKKLEAVYQDCATFYCEDPTKGASDEIGKKIFKSILYVFNTEKMFYEIEEKRKKEEGRKATTNSMAFNSKIEEPKHNPEIMKPPAPTPIKLPMPPLPPKPQVPEISAEERMKEIEKSQQEKEKKFLEEMMKKRTSKIVAFRQSRAPNMPGTGLKKNQEIEIDFLKGL